jgi:hypothetical protein
MMAVNIPVAIVAMLGMGGLAYADNTAPVALDMNVTLGGNSLLDITLDVDDAEDTSLFVECHIIKSPTFGTVTFPITTHAKTSVVLGKMLSSKNTSGLFSLL